MTSGGLSGDSSSDNQETVALPNVNPTRAESRAQASGRSLVTGSASGPRAASGRSSGSTGPIRQTPSARGSAASTGAARGAEREGSSITDRMSSALESAAARTSGARAAFREAADRAETHSRPARSTTGKRPPRRAKLTLTHVNVYSVFKLACVLSIVLFLVWMLAIVVLYGVLDLVGVIDRVNNAASTIAGGDSNSTVVTPWLVFGVAIIVGALNMVLFIAGTTVGAMVYNLCAELVGGVEVTLSERD